MALKKADKQNFATLLDAARNGDLALIETTDAKTGGYRAAICAVAFDGKEYRITPFGHLVTGNPFEIYSDPTANLADAEPQIDCGSGKVVRS